MWMRTNSWVSNQVTQQPCRCERNTRTKLLKAGGQEKNFKSFRGVKESLWRKELRSSTTSGLLRNKPGSRKPHLWRQKSKPSILNPVSSDKILPRKKYPSTPKDTFQKLREFAPCRLCYKGSMENVLQIGESIPERNLGAQGGMKAWKENCKMVSLKKISKVERGPAGNEETQREREGPREINDCVHSRVRVCENVTGKANIN